MYRFLFRKFRSRFERFRGRRHFRLFGIRISLRLSVYGILDEIDRAFVRNLFPGLHSPFGQQAFGFRDVWNLVAFFQLGSAHDGVDHLLAIELFEFVVLHDLVRGLPERSLHAYSLRLFDFAGDRSTFIHGVGTTHVVGGFVRNACIFHHFVYDLVSKISVVGFQTFYRFEGFVSGSYLVHRNRTVYGLSQLLNLIQWFRKPSGYDVFVYCRRRLAFQIVFDSAQFHDLPGLLLRHAFQPLLRRLHGKFDFRRNTGASSKGTTLNGFVCTIPSEWKAEQGGNGSLDHSLFMAFVQHPRDRIVRRTPVRHGFWNGRETFSIRSHAKRRNHIGGHLRNGIGPTAKRLCRHFVPELLFRFASGYIFFRLFDYGGLLRRWFHAHSIHGPVGTGIESHRDIVEHGTSALDKVGPHALSCEKLTSLGGLFGREFRSVYSLLSGWDYSAKGRECLARKGATLRGGSRHPKLFEIAGHVATSNRRVLKGNLDRPVVS